MVVNSGFILVGPSFSALLLLLFVVLFPMVVVFSGELIHRPDRIFVGGLVHDAAVDVGIAKMPRHRDIEITC